MLTRPQALGILSRYGIPRDVDFLALPSSLVEAVIAAADEYHYHAPKNANGSRARCFHAYVMRIARRRS